MFFILQELEDPLILIHDKKISNMHAVVKVLEMALKVLVCFNETLANISVTVVFADNSD
jgi:hypothetical protein